MLLMSTIIYVRDLEKNTPVFEAENNVNLPTITRQAAYNTIVSALANVTNGGNSDILNQDLNMLRSALISASHNAILQINYSPLDSLPYVDGMCISWRTNGTGVSSMIVSFQTNSSEISGEEFSEYTVNVTSSISTSGSFTQINASARQADIRCTLENDGFFASTGSIEVNYKVEGVSDWSAVTELRRVDFGNGTNLLSFDLDMNPNPLWVSVHCVDRRGISVWANSTMT
jgi:hypothetical protein